MTLISFQDVLIYDGAGDSTCIHIHVYCRIQKNILYACPKLSSRRTYTWVSYCSSQIHLNYEYWICNGHKHWICITEEGKKTPLYFFNHNVYDKIIKIKKTETKYTLKDPKLLKQSMLHLDMLEFVILSQKNISPYYLNKTCLHSLPPSQLQKTIHKIEDKDAALKFNSGGRKYFGCGSTSHLRGNPYCPNYNYFEPSSDKVKSEYKDKVNLKNTK